MFLALMLLIVAHPVNAQSVMTAPAASPSPPAGFSGRAHITVSVPIRDARIAVTARVAIAQRDQRTRIDVLSIQTSIAPIPLGPITVIVDRAGNTVTLWNDATRTFYSQTFLPSLFGRSATSAPVPRPSLPMRSPLADFDLLTFDLRLTGHTATAGLATTGIALDMKVRKHGTTAVVHAHGSVQLADDYAFFPAAVNLRVQAAGAPSPAVIAYLVDAFTREPPTADVFEIPAGYTEAPSLIAVVTGMTLRRRTPSATPAPTAMPSALATP